MKYFWESTGSIPDGVGFSHYDPVHVIWLTVFVAVTVSVSLYYRAASERAKKITRFTVMGLIVLDELAKLTMLLITGLWTKNYLPFHLCTINIFIIVWHAFKPNRITDNFLYAICVPSALAALFFPSWTKLPPANFMLIHSFTVHILLALYPIILTVGGTIKPRLREIPKCILLLVGMAIPVYFVNMILDTNYMFLMEAEAGNPLKLFEDAFGNHLIGFPIILLAALTVFYTPWEIVRFIKKKKAARSENEKAENEEA